ncbi:MAG: HTH-type transcriptional regulator IscR [Pseudomonadota bacterium]|jgi:Rrf2 family iron-sulfur cluster assembly transcriptional regulator
MRMSSKGRYAVVAVLDVAANAGVKPVSLADVAIRQRISLSYLEQLFAMLRRAGLVAASRGPGGGYRLQRPAAEITVGQVFQAVEDGGNSNENGSRDWTEGPAAALWQALDAHIDRFLETVTLADLLAGEVEEPVRRRTSLSA